MVDGAKLGSPVCSAFEVLVVRHVVERSPTWRRTGPFCWPVLPAGVGGFRCISSIC